MRLPRFLTGTTDHDGDGRMGGSNKGTKIMAKRATKTSTKEVNAALDAQAATMATAPDPMTGQGMVTEDQPTRTQVKKAQQAELEGQFAEADGKGQPKSEEIVFNQLQNAARGF